MNGRKPPSNRDFFVFAARLGPRRFGVAALCAVALVAPWVDLRMSAGDEITTSSTPAGIFYRRIFVPADHVESWPRNGEKFLPIEARDFDAWTKAANAEFAGDLTTAHIDAAEYTARLDDIGLMVGQGRWTISAPTRKPSFLPLGEMSLIVREPRWVHSPQKSVRLGAWGRSAGLADRYGLEVLGADVLEFDWHAAAITNAGGVELAWVLPPANSSKLLLDIPDGMQPVIPSGVVLGSRLLPADAPEDTKRRRRWELAVGPATPTTLRVVNLEANRREFQLPIALHDDVTYTVTQHGLEIVVKWRLHDPAGLTRELSVPLPEGIQLSAIQANGHDLPWRLERDAQAALSSARIDLSQHVDSRSLEITVSAWHPPVLDQSWTLPTLRPGGVFWTSGDITLSVEPEFEVRRLTPVGCTQTAVRLSGEQNNNPEVHSFSGYSPTATLDAIIVRRMPQPSVRLGTSLSLADPDLNGRLVAQWSVSSDSVHRLSGQIAPNWSIESVETVPAEALGEWFVDQRGGNKLLEIQLARALTPSRAISVIMTGRLQQFGLNKPISADTLRMVRWDNAKVERQLLTLQTVEPFAADNIGELPTLAADKLDQQDRALLDQSAETSSIYDLAEAADDAGVQLSLKRGQYQAEITVDAILDEQQLRQEYHLVIRPKSTAIDRLPIYITAPVGDKLQWTEVTSGTTLSAERLPSDSQGTTFPQGGEMWLVRLPRTTAGTIQIHANWASPWSAKQRLPLVSAPEADEQLGRVRVCSEFATTPLIDSHNIEAVPLPASNGADTSDRDVPVRAIFQYNPANCWKATQAPELAIDQRAASGTSPLIAQNLALVSFISADGMASHRATYDLENQGAKSFELQLPTGAQLNSATLDGRVIEPATLRQPDGRLSIDLPRNAQSTLTINFETHEQRLSNGELLSPPLLNSEIPLLSGDWTIWLPEEFAISPNSSSDSQIAPSWHQRLFGPLARSNETTPFNPLRTDDWMQPVNEFADWWNGTAAKSAISTPHAGDVTPVGWHSFRTAFVADRPPAVVLERSSASVSSAVAVLLLCIVFGRWLRARHLNVFAGILVVAALLALVLPAAYSPLAAGALLGLLGSLIARWTTKPKNVDESHPRWTQTTVASATALIAIALFGGQLALAQETIDKDQPVQPAMDQAIQTVLIPVDADGRRAGTKYYVSEQFLRELMRAADENEFPAGQWLMFGAEYSCELRPNADRSGVISGDWTLTFEVETLERETTIGLPLVLSEADWKETAMLDGVPVPIAWRDDGRRCEVEIPEPGRYSLSLTCVPHVAVSDGQSRLELTIPPFVAAHVQLKRPAELSSVRILGAPDMQPFPGSVNIVTADLGPANRLAIQWNHLGLFEGNIAAAQLTEMDWLRVNQSEILLETKYSLDGDGVLPRAIAIRADEGWELVPPANQEIEIDRGADRSLNVLLPPSDSDRRDLQLQWRLANAPALGRLRIPRMEVTSAPVSRRWMAISAAPSLDFEIFGGPETSATANEFLVHWGDEAAKTEPQLILGNLVPTSDCVLAIKPRQIDPTADEVLHIAVDRESLRIIDEVDVMPGTDHDFQFEFSIPEALSISRVSLTQGNQSVPVRWSRASDRQLKVFFSKQVSSKYRLVLSGEMPLNAASTIPLPRISAANVTGSAQRIQLYHNEDVSVAVSGVADSDTSHDDPLAPPPAGWNFRTIDKLHVGKTSDKTVALSVTPNDVELVGSSLITLSREPDSWSATLHCRLDIKNGDIGTIKLHVPTSWIGPFEIKSSFPAAISIVSANEQSAILAVRFAELVPAGKSVDLNIRGPIAVSLTAPVAVPQIVIDAQPNIQSFARVPNSLESQPLAWTQVGVRPATLPHELQLAAGDQAAWSTFAIVDNPFRLAFQPQSASNPSPLIRLADTTIVNGSAKEALLLTRLTVASHGLSECTLKMPPGQELLAVNLDGQPALIRPADIKNWRLSLGPAQLPQFVEIVSRTAPRQEAVASDSLRRPSLWSKGRELPVEMSLWSISQPSTTDQRRIKLTSTVTANELAALRLDRMVSIAESAAPLAAELTSPDNQNWFHCWANLLTSLNREATDSTEQASQLSPSDQVSRIPDEQLQHATEHLNAWITKWEKYLQNPNVLQVAALPADRRLGSFKRPLPTQDAREWTYYVTDAGSDRSPINVGSIGESAFSQTAAALLALFGIAGGSWWLTHSPPARDLVCRWPNAVGVLIGLAYWAWLWPSWLGLAIVVACVVTSLRSGWPGRSLRMEASTVVRASSRN